MSEILPAIHLVGRVSTVPTAACARNNSLLHNLEVDLLHINLLTELRWKFGRLEKPRIDAGSHVERRCTVNVGKRHVAEEKVAA